MRDAFTLSQPMRVSRIQYSFHRQMSPLRCTLVMR
jgi:hypothetical protein